MEQLNDELLHPPKRIYQKVNVKVIRSKVTDLFGKIRSILDIHLMQSFNVLIHKGYWNEENVFIKLFSAKTCSKHAAGVIELTFYFIDL